MLSANMPDAGKKNIAVIGAGPGGYAAAFLAADLGLQVTLIDEQPDPGGVCLYVGCIPSKALLHVAKVVNEARHAAAWGVDFGAPKIDLARLRTWKEGVVRKLTGGLGQLSKQRQVRYLRGRAGFVNSTTLAVKTSDGAPGEGRPNKEERLTFDHIIIATGSRPATVPGLSLASPRVMNSTDALALADIPKTLLVVGGGYIGLELGSVYAALGARVSVVEMLPGLLPGADRDLVLPLHKTLERAFAAIMLSTKVAAVEEVKDGIRVRFEGEGAKEKEQVFEKILVSVGRQPNSDIPGLENTRVEKTPRGFIEVDAQRRTADPAIYAVGDVAGEPMLAHKASHEGRVAVGSHRRAPGRLRAARHSRGRLHRSRRWRGAGSPNRRPSRKAAPSRSRASPGPPPAAPPPSTARTASPSSSSSRKPSACSGSASPARAPANSSPKACSRLRWAPQPATSSSASIPIPRSPKP